MAQARAEVLLTALDARKTRDGSLRIVQYNRDVGAELSEDWSNDTFGLFQHRDKQMLRLDLLVLIPFGKLYRSLNCFLSPKGKLI